MSTVATAHKGIEFDTPSSLRSWIVCLTAGLFFFYEFIQMHMCDALSVHLMRDFGLKGSEFGALSSTYLWADVLFLIPAGLIIDRTSVRKVILAAMSLCVLGTFGFAWSTSFLGAAISHGLSGIGNAFCFLCCMILATRWFPSHRQALVMGSVVTMAMIGGYVSHDPLASLSNAIGWRNAIVWDGILGLVIMGVIWKIVHDYPPHLAHQANTNKKAINAMGLKKSFVQALKNIHNWYAGFYTGLLNLPIMVIGAVFGSLYLQQIRGVDSSMAPHICSMIFFGTIVGSPLFGWISDKLQKRRLPMLMGGLASLVVLVALLATPTISNSQLYVLFFLLGFFSSSQIITYPTIGELNSKVVSGTAMSVVSTVIMGWAAVAQSITGALLDWRWDGQMVEGVRLYSKTNFYDGFSIIFLGILISIICAFLLRETNCKPIEEKE